MHSSHRIPLSVKIACTNSSIPAIAASAILSLTVPIVVHVSLLCRMYPMIAKRRPCASFPCVQPARRNITIHSTAAFTRSPTPVRSADRRYACWRNNPVGAGEAWMMGGDHERDQAALYSGHPQGERSKEKYKKIQPLRLRSIRQRNI